MRRIDVQVRIQSNTLTDFVGGQQNSMRFYAHIVRQQIASAASQEACWAEEFSTLEKFAISSRDVGSR